MFAFAFQRSRQLNQFCFTDSPPGHNICHFWLSCGDGSCLIQSYHTDLACSLQGTALEPEAADKDSRENAYYSAYRLGLLRPAERDDNAVLSRADVVRMLLDAAGYGPAARLGGIYTCAYSDKGSIPAEGLGYAALAQALGLASRTYAGSRTATRGEAASMLCRVLERAA